MEGRDMGRYGEIWGDMGRCGEMWGDAGRYGEMRGDAGRFGEMLALLLRALRLELLRCVKAIGEGEVRGRWAMGGGEGVMGAVRGEMCTGAFGRWRRS